MTSQSDNNVVSFDVVNKTFITSVATIHAVNNISFQIKKGSLTGIIGPDGAGKTTLLRLAAGLLIPDSGHIEILGHDTVTEVDKIHSQIGYMPQRFGLYEDLTVMENMNLYANLHNLPQSKRQARSQQLMQMSGLASFESRLAGKLSGGMKQKLGLTCTLLSQPEFLILDEPSVGVDPVSRRELWQILEQQISETGMTVLLSTAYMDEAERCDDVFLLNDGQIIEQGSPADFKQEMVGHTFIITSNKISHRQLQTKLSGQPGIIDTVIQGEKLRIICENPGQPDFTTMDSPSTSTTILPVEPRLEDAFISILSTHQGLELNKLSPQKSTQMTRQAITSDNDIVIDVVDIDRWFGNFQAVKKINFQVKRGEVFGLLGANGAGKTTTFRMLCGLLPISHGQVQVVGLDFHQAAAQARAQIGYMSQKFSLYSSLTVMQNLTFFSSAYGLRKKKQKQQIQWAIDKFELSNYLNSTSGDLSQGYKQRLSMACALMHEPEVLFLDEPTSGVDPLARRGFWSRINQLAANGVTIMVTTHFMEEAEYCDRLVIMREGAILTSGTPTMIKADASSTINPDPTMEDAFIALVEKTGEH